MARQARILGVHPIEAGEPVHLIELLIEGALADFNIDEVTQESSGEPRMNWQAPWDDQMFDDAYGKVSYTFFFHHLDLTKPLLTSFGPLSLPTPTTIPARLLALRYEAP